MSDRPTLQELLAETIAEFCASDGFGIPVGFVYCVSRIDEDGQQVLTIGSHLGQPTHVSLGMTAYLTKNFEMDAEHELTCCYALEDEDE